MPVTICRLFVLSRRKDDKTIIIVFSPRKDDETKSRQNAKRKVDKYIIQPANLSSFRSVFCRHVVFSGRKDDNYHFVVLSSFRGEKTTIQQNAKRKDDKLGR